MGEDSRRFSRERKKKKKKKKKKKLKKKKKKKKKKNLQIKQIAYVCLIKLISSNETSFLYLSKKT